MVGVETTPGHVTVRMRIYNGQSQPVHITPDTIWLALGYAPEPSGPRVPAETLEPFDLLSGQAADLTVRWTWAGEPFGSIGIGPYEYSVQLNK